MTNKANTIAVPCKQDIGKCLLKPDRAAVPVLRDIGRDVGRSYFMISVDAEDRRLEAVEHRFHRYVTLIKAEVGSYIAEDHGGIGSRQIEPLAEPHDLECRTVSVPSKVNHLDRNLSATIISAYLPEILDTQKT